MSTRLAIFCDQLLEMGWLAALITAPLFFDVYSSRVFEPDKIALVRSLALMMAGAWLIKITNGVLGGWSLRSWLGENPLGLATLAVVVTNLLATILSIAPSISLWGSYQRLQGLYTTLSYILIFFMAASTLRTRAQFDRAINTAIVVGFPIAYYGLLQHYGLDTLPWGGDVVVRVASNMGNSIFVAAYLIMVVPIALARWIEALGKVAQEKTRWVVVLIFFSLIALSAVWAVNFTYGWVLACAIILALLAFALLTKINVRNALLAAVYTVVLAVLFVAIFFTQSRGPWLGLAGGLFSFALLYALVRGTRRFVFGSIALAIVGVLFLTAFNLPASPLDSLKQVPYVGRLGRLLETESGTGKVRELIWQGAVQLILPHAPLWSPTTGDDPFNTVRPLIGYGPEAMYVAYNPFYPPDLGHIESRNASPDRSHNETFDSLVMTGILGFATYIFLFISIFYFGLKSLGMIQSSGQRITLVVLWLGGGFVSATGFGLWRGWNFVGVALAFGMVVGFFIFLVLDALLAPSSAPSINGESSDARGNRVNPETGLWIAALLAAFIAHFIEINFGIAIVSTRTYFWFYAALLVVLGMNRLTVPSAVRPANPQQQNQTLTQAVLPKSDTRSSRRRRRARSAQPKVRMSTDGSLTNSLTWTFITALVILTLVFEFVSNQGAANNPADAMLHSLFLKDNNTSYAIFSMLVGTLILAGILGYDESLRGEARWLAIAIFVVLTFTAAMWFILLQTKWLVEAVGGNATEKFAYLLAWYYGWLFLLVFAAAFSLWTVAAQTSPIFSRSSVSVVLAPLAIIIVSILIYVTNYTTVVADIIYKTGTNFDGIGAWDRSIDAYERAYSLQTNQDFYLLFMGRAYLEAARTVPDPNQRLKFLQTSEQRLLLARQINPYNTDHSANLARLNRIWATMTDAPADKAAHIQKSLDYYRDATHLSPNTAHLYNEWSTTYFLNNNTDKALAMLQRSLQLDQQFAQTYQYLGDYYSSQHNDAQAVDYYLKAIALDPGALNGPDGVPAPATMQLFVKPDVTPRVIDAYHAASSEHPDSAVAYVVISEIYKRTGQNDRARQELEQAVKISPKDLGINLALVNLLSATGQIDAAVNVMHHILEIVPTQNQDYARFQEFNASLLNLQRALAAVQKSPDDVNAHRTLAAMWKARGQAEFALPEYRTVVRLAADDYDAAKNIALIDLGLSRTDEAQGAISVAAALATDKEKPIWQNLQSALNNQKLRKYDDAAKDAKAALALASDADEPAIQAYINLLLEQVGGK